MNDSGLRALLERVAADVTAPDDVGARAWEAARRRSRRSTIVTVGALGVATALVVAFVAGPLANDRATPAVTTPATTSVQSGLVGPVPDYAARLRAVIQPTWHDADIASLPRLQTSLPRRLAPFAGEAPSLSAHPVAAALAVAQRTTGRTVDIRVLGIDGGWRWLDAPELVPTISGGEVVSLLTGAPISPDGTKLALSQPHAVVIVDLTSGASHRIALPTEEVPARVPRSVLWSPDGEQVIIGPQSRFGYRGSILVDLRSDVGPLLVPYDTDFATFDPDGSVIELRDVGCGFCELDRYDGVNRADGVLLGVEQYPQRPAAGSEAIAVARAVRSWNGPKAAPINSDGILVVDRDDGAPLAMLPMPTQGQAENVALLGWLDAKTVLMRVPATDASGGAVNALIAWNYQTGGLFTAVEPWSAVAGVDIAFAVDAL
jgi:hypothetical protein